MDTSELYARGLRRRKKMFGEADVEKRMAAAGEFGAPLQNIINAYVYGDVWERSGLPDDIRSLVMLGITAASNKPAEFRVHAKGALANGCTREQVQDVLLLVAMYCGVPAAIETNRIAAEIFGEAPGLPIRPAEAVSAKPQRMSMKSVPTIDAHHHIWRLNDLPWLSGPQVPRIFGPYQPICRDYPIDEYRSDIAGCDIVKSIYIQTNWPAGKSYDEARWVQSVADETGWPHANVAHADLADPDAGSLLEASGEVAGDARHSPAIALARKSAISLCAAARCHERRGLAPRTGAACRSRIAVRTADICKPDGGRCAAGARRSRTRSSCSNMPACWKTCRRTAGSSGATAWRRWRMSERQRQALRARHVRSCLP